MTLFVKKGILIEISSFIRLFQTIYNTFLLFIKVQQTFLGYSQYISKRNDDPDIIWKENHGDIHNNTQQ